MATKAPPSPPVPAACTDVVEFFTTSCPLSWDGITVYGTVDTGISWQSHGTRFNPSYGPGLEPLISSNLNRALWNIAPNGLSQSFIGIKGKEPFAPGWSFIFDLQAGFDPYWLQLANGPKSQLENNGVAAANQSSNGDFEPSGSVLQRRGLCGYQFADLWHLDRWPAKFPYLGRCHCIRSPGRFVCFLADRISGTTAGVGDTEDARFLRQRNTASTSANSGRRRFINSAATRLTTPRPTPTSCKPAWTFPPGLTASFRSTRYTAASTMRWHRSCSRRRKTRSFPALLAARISDDSSVMLLGKYTYGPVQVYGGYERIAFAAPSNPQTTFTDIGGYTVVSADISNSFFDGRVLNVSWTGQDMQ